MVPCPSVAPGHYLVTKQLPTAIRCKAYTHPLVNGGGEYITTIDPGTTIGPVEEVRFTGQFLSVLIRGYWINVWAADRGGVMFAYRVPEGIVRGWRARGWRDQP